MLNALVVLLGCQLAGEAIARLSATPVPGPVIGLALLAGALLLFRRPVPQALSATAHGILRHLSLLFVPAAVGLVQHLDVAAAHGPALIATLVLSALVTMAVTALVFRAAARRFSPASADGDEDGEARP